jgi:hypothetical protein
MRIRAIDWVRGMVMLLMTVDHAGNVFDAAHMHGDNGARWIPGSPLPAGEFLTRSSSCSPARRSRCRRRSGGTSRGKRASS